MNFSLFFFSADATVGLDAGYDFVIDCARFADTHDFEAVWIPERHFARHGSAYPSPSVLHAALARETHRVRLRAGSVVMPLHDPLRVAEEWAMVDNLSDGRVGMAVASGWHPNDFAFFPERYPDRREWAFRGLETVRRLWRGESVRARNGVGEEVELRTHPRPRQAELPVWVTASGNVRTFERAGEVGAHLLTHLIDQDPEALAEKIALYRRARAAHGHDPATGVVTLMAHTFIGDDLDRVRRTVHGPFCAFLKSLSRELLAGLSHSRSSAASLDELAPEELDELVDFAFERYFSTRALLGTKESCAPLVARLEEVGVNELACMLDFGVAPELVVSHLGYLDGLRRRASRAISLASIRARCTEATDVDLPPMIERLTRTRGEVLARLRPGTPDPELLERCAAWLLPILGAAGTGIRAIERLRLSARPAQATWCHLQAHPGDGLFDVHLFDEAGEILIEALGLRSADAAALPLPESPAARLDRSDACYERRFEPRPRLREAEPHRAPPGAWLVLAGDGELAAKLCEHLRGAGATVLHRRPGDDLSPLLQSTSLQGALLLALQGPEPVHEAIRLLQALHAADLRPKLWLATRGAQPVGGAGLRDLAGAALWGLGPAIAQEHPALWGGLVDLDPDAAADTSARELAQAVLSPDDEDQLAFRRAERYAARLAHCEVPAPAQPLRFRPDGTYLIAGGFGGLGSQVARWLVQRGARHLVLLGRTELPPRAQWEGLAHDGERASRIRTVRELEEAGARVHASALEDGTDPRTHLDSLLRTLAADGWPPMRGALHAATVFEGVRPLAEIDLGSVARTLRAKVGLGQALHEALEHEPLDFFVLFSSFASVLGQLGRGLGAYGAANAWLDALAHHRRARGLPGLAIDWGSWEQVGMRARLVAAGSNLLRRDWTFSPAEGLAALERLMCADSPQVLYAPIHWRDFRETFSRLRGDALLEHLVERDTPSRAGASVSARELLATPAPERPGRLREYLRDVAASVLRFPRGRLPDGEPLISLGLDSLTALQLRNRVESDLGVTVSVVELLRGQTVTALTDTVALRLPHDSPSLPGGPALAPGALPDRVDELSDEEVDSLLRRMLPAGSAR